MLAIPLRTLGRTGLQVSLIGFGALEIGRDWGIGPPERRKRPAENQAGSTLREVLDFKVNLIDTASAYHRSEERIGKFIASRRREFILATKCGEHNGEPGTFYDFSYEAVRASIDGSLRLLQTNVIDILQIHFGPDPEQVLDDGGCVRAMKEAQEQGKVRWLGASVDGPVLDRCIESGEFDVVQVGYSLMRQEEEARIAKAHDRGIGVLIRSGLGGGWLTSRALDVPANDRPVVVQKLLELCGGDARLLTTLALQFLARNAGIGSVLIGSGTSAHVRTAILALGEPVDQETLQRAIAIAREAA
ncbi:MAG: aldo/keto reductase [Bacteroidota bacterium]